MGHRTALSTVEEFGLLDALHPGRLDLGLGRSSGKPAAVKEPTPVRDAAAALIDGWTDNGLRIPKKWSPAALLSSPRFVLHKTLLPQPNAQPQNYTEQVGDILDLLAGTYARPNGQAVTSCPVRAPRCRSGS